MRNEDWEKVANRLRAVFNLGIEKAEWVQNCRMARFIAAVPFLSGCDKALETSFTHLAVYYMSIDDLSRDIYFHKPDDDEDLYKRLSPISGFKNGDPAIIQCCMDLIALNMVSNYKNDVEKDEKIGKYNPIAAGKWNYDEIHGRLTESISKNMTDEIAELYTVDEAVNGLWAD